MEDTLHRGQYYVLVHATQACCCLLCPQVTVVPRITPLCCADPAVLCCAVLPWCADPGTCMSARLSTREVCQSATRSSGSLSSQTGPWVTKLFSGTLQSMAPHTQTSTACGQTHQATCTSPVMQTAKLSCCLLRALSSSLSSYLLPTSQTLSLVARTAKHWWLLEAAGLGLCPRPSSQQPRGVRRWWGPRPHLEGPGRCCRTACLQSWGDMGSVG